MKKSLMFTLAMMLTGSVARAENLQVTGPTAQSLFRQGMTLHFNTIRCMFHFQSAQGGKTSSLPGPLAVYVCNMDAHVTLAGVNTLIADSPAGITIVGNSADELLQAGFATGTSPLGSVQCSALYGSPAGKGTCEIQLK